MPISPKYTWLACAIVGDTWVTPSRTKYLSFSSLQRAPCFRIPWAWFEVNLIFVGSFSFRVKDLLLELDADEFVDTEVVAVESSPDKGLSRELLLETLTVAPIGLWRIGSSFSSRSLACLTRRWSDQSEISWPLNPAHFKAKVTGMVPFSATWKRVAALWTWSSTFLLSMATSMGSPPTHADHRYSKTSMH